MFSAGTWYMLYRRYGIFETSLDQDTFWKGLGANLLQTVFFPMLFHAVAMWNGRQYVSWWSDLTHRWVLSCKGSEPASGQKWGEGWGPGWEDWQGGAVLPFGKRSAEPVTIGFKTVPCTILWKVFFHHFVGYTQERHVAISFVQGHKISLSSCWSKQALRLKSLWSKTEDALS